MHLNFSWEIWTCGWSKIKNVVNFSVSKMIVCPLFNFWVLDTLYSHSQQNIDKNMSLQNDHHWKSRLLLMLDNLRRLILLRLVVFSCYPGSQRAWVRQRLTLFLIWRDLDMRKKYGHDIVYQKIWGNTDLNGQPPCPYSDGVPLSHQDPSQLVF